MLSVSNELLSSNPGFANLWSQIQSQLSRDGALPLIEEEVEAARKELEEQRGKYLEHATLLRGLEEVVALNKLQQVTEDDKSRRKGRWDSEQAQQDFHALAQTLQVARAMQRLQLPTALRANPPPGLATGAEPQLFGDLDQYLGITSTTLVQCHAERNTLAKPAQLSLLSALEEVLRTDAATLAAAVGTGLDAKGRLGPATIDAIQSKVSAVRAGKSNYLACYKALLGCLQEYLQVVMQAQDLLVTLIQDCMLTKQRAMDEVTCHHLIVQARTMYSKLRVIEQQFWLSTYTSNNLLALNAIHSCLQHAFDTTVSACNEIAAHLTAYRGLGEDFDKIVKEYASIQEELTRMYHTLDQFNELQRELEEGVPHEL